MSVPIGCMNWGIGWQNPVIPGTKGLPGLRRSKAERRRNMRRHCGKKGYFLIFLLLGIFLLVPTVQVAAQGAKTVESGLQSAALAPENVDSHIAGMSDVKVRQAYAQKLKQEAAAKTTSKPEGKGILKGVNAKFYGAARGAAAVLNRAGSFFSGEQNDSR